MSQAILDLLDANAPSDAVKSVCAWIASDPLAVLCCATAVAQSGRTLPDFVTEAARAQAKALTQAQPDAVRDELTRMLVLRDVDVALQWLRAAGALAVLLPELEATVDFSQEGGRRHKDVWEHTKQVVKQAVPRVEVRWAALLHDIGKVPTRTFTEGGKVHFHGHAEVGARMFKPIAKRFAFGHELRENVRFLILHHLRAGQYAPSWTDSAVRRLGREMGERLVDLLDLSRADITSKRPGRRQTLLEQISALGRRIEELRVLDAKMPPLPKGLGTAITERFGIPPSKRIGDLRRALEEACERGELEERRDDEYYLAWLAKSSLVS